jgi:two-component system, OmpR family, sensor histidine kinase BaeS
VAAALGLLALTGVILASAAVRLGLYQQIYGWTELRFYVAASIGWLAICGVVATVLLLRNRMAWLFHGLAFGAVAVTLAVSAIGPQAFVAGQNVARALDLSLVPPEGYAGLDADYIAGLGDDAVPIVVDALQRLDAASRASLLRVLDARRAQLAEDGPEAAWQAWNLSRERARTALETLPGH